MIKVKMENAVAAYAALERLASLPMRPKTSYDVMKLFKKVSGEYKFFEEERIKLIKKYGVKREPKNEDERARLGNEVWEATDPEFQAEFKSLLDLDVEINAKPIDLTVLLTEDVKLVPTDLLGLEVFITGGD